VAHRPRTPRAPLPPGFWTIWSTVAIDMLGFGIILPVIAIYTERFGAGSITIGFLVASFSLAQFVAAPLLGRLSDKIGRKPVILVSLFGTAVGSVLTGAAMGVWMLFLGRVIDGASGASVSVAQGAVTDVAPPDQRARLLGLLGAAFGVGFVVGPALGGIAALVGERVPFFLAGAIALVNAVVAVKRLPETRQPPALVMAHEHRIEEDIVASQRRADLTRLALISFVATAAFAAFETTFALLGQDRFGLTEASVAVVFVFIGLALVAVQGGLIRPVTDRFGVTRTLRLGLVANAVGLFVLAFAESWWVFVLSLALLVVGQGLAMPTLAASAANRARDEARGGALGFLQSASALARIAGPAVAGVLFALAIPVPYVLGSVMMLIAVALLAAMELPSPSTAATFPLEP
jgi:MFS transporter, DHA1 family, tetracycline resistance protein